MIFLDNASTSRVFSEVVKAMNDIYTEEYYNPSARYSAADGVKSLILNAREFLADKLGVNKQELFFTSGATEANTWAIQNGFKNKKGNFVVSCGEHASIYENALLHKSKGYDVRFVPLTKDGTVNENLFAEAVDSDTCLVSAIHCNNETGAVNDLKKLSQIAKAKNSDLIFHADGVQAFGKLPIYLPALGVDMYSVSAHKIGGPKGVGALVIRKPQKLAPYIVGGGQENGNRSGTENSAGIVGFSVALQCFLKKYNPAKIADYHKKVLAAAALLGGSGHCAEHGSKHILSVSFEGIKSETLQSMLSDSGVLIGIGSACSGSSKHNRVLTEMGLSQKQIEGSVRISFGVENTEQEIETALQNIREKIANLRGKTIG